MADEKEIKLKASLDPFKKCIFIDGEGAASVKFDTDATQLAPLLTAFAEFKGKCLELTIKGLDEDYHAGRVKKSKTHR